MIFSPDGQELGKYRGYIEPAAFLAILQAVADGKREQEGAQDRSAAKAPTTPLSEETLAWIESATERELDDYWDEDEGGWGRRQKAPLGGNNAWLLLKAERGDALSRRRILFTLDKQSALLDPVWGGIYQYSAASRWDAPHFEKLLSYQAAAIENYASAYRLSKDEKQLARAKGIVRYVDAFLRSPDGAFYATQDADLNAHERELPFMAGHDFYRQGDAARRARGIPRVDTHVYAKENGLGVAAYVTMFEATKEPTFLASAVRAAATVTTTHTATSGGVTHDANDPERPEKLLYLADNVAFAFGLVRLYEATANPEYLVRARAISDVVTRELADETTGAFYATSKDPDAVGVFAERRVPFDDNVVAVRVLARLCKATKPANTAYATTIGRVLRAISTPAQLKERGRWLGDYLLALEETKGCR